MFPLGYHEIARVCPYFSHQVLSLMCLGMRSSLHLLYACLVSLLASFGVILAFTIILCLPVFLGLGTAISLQLMGDVKQRSDMTMAIPESQGVISHAITPIEAAHVTVYVKIY